MRNKVHLYECVYVEEIAFIYDNDVDDDSDDDNDASSQCTQHGPRPCLFLPSQTSVHPARPSNLASNCNLTFCRGRQLAAETSRYLVVPTLMTAVNDKQRRKQNRSLTRARVHCARRARHEARYERRRQRHEAAPANALDARC